MTLSAYHVSPDFPDAIQDSRIQLARVFCDFLLAERVICVAWWLELEHSLELAAPDILAG